MKQLPKYWYLKKDESNPLWEKFMDWFILKYSPDSNNVRGMWLLYGYEDGGERNGYNCWDTPDRFKNNPQLITLEEWHEATKESPLQEQVGGSHYKDFAIQPIEFITKNKLSFIEGCIVKYICRHREKNGKQDLEKIKHYVDLLIALEYK